MWHYVAPRSWSWISLAFSPIGLEGKLILDLYLGKTSPWSIPYVCRWPTTQPTLWGPDRAGAEGAAGSDQTPQTRWAWFWCTQWTTQSPPLKSTQQEGMGKWVSFGSCFYTFVFVWRERALCICTHILDVIEAQRSSFPTVLQRLCGEGFVVTMEETEEPTDDAWLLQIIILYISKLLLKGLYKWKPTGMIHDAVVMTCV